VARIVKTSVQGKKIIDDLLTRNPTAVRVVMRNAASSIRRLSRIACLRAFLPGLVRVLRTMKPRRHRRVKTSGCGPGGAGFPPGSVEITRECRVRTNTSSAMATGRSGASWTATSSKGTHSVRRRLDHRATPSAPCAATSHPRRVSVAVRRVEKAIVEARAAGLARGKHPGGLLFDAKVRLGAGRLRPGGEETA